MTDTTQAEASLGDLIPKAPEALPDSPLTVENIAASADPVGAAQAELDRMSADKAFLKRLYDGDRDAQAEFDQLSRVAAGVALPEAQKHTAADYYVPDQVLANFPKDGRDQAAKDGVEWATSLNLRPDVAKGIWDCTSTGLARQRGMNEAQQSAYQNGQEAQFREAFTGKQIADAARVLRTQSGKDIDLTNVARTSAMAAISLVHHAVELVRTGQVKG